MQDNLYYKGCFFLLGPDIKIDKQLFDKLDNVYNIYCAGGLKDKVKHIDGKIIINLTEGSIN